MVCICHIFFFFFFSSRRRHTRCYRDWSSDVCSSDLSGYPAEWWIDQGAIVWEDAADGRINCIARDPLLPALGEAVERAFAAEHAVQWWLALNQDLDRAIDLVEGALRHGERNVLDELLHLRELAE